MHLSAISLAITACRGGASGSLNLLIDGDSIAAGQAGTSYGARYAAAYPLKAYANTAVGGSNIAGLVGRQTTDNTHYDASALSIFSPFIGANDLLTVSAATFLSSLSSYLTTMKSAGWAIALCTVLPQGTAAGGAAFNAKRATVNTTLRTWVGVYCDVLVDFDTTLMGSTDAIADNATYYQSGLHPVDAGYALMFPCFAAAVNSLTMPLCYTPVILPAAGSFAANVTVVLTTQTSGASIYYTTDGTDPTSSGTRTLYTGSFSLTSSKTVKAVAIKAGATTSAVSTTAYTVTGGGDADVTAWQVAAGANGGTYSASTQAAAITFVTNAKANAYWTKLSRINLFCGDQLAGALTPLKAGAGTASETNNGFVAADYTEATGIQGGSSKYIDTGLNANTLTTNSTHLSVYNRNTSAAGGERTIGSGGAFNIYAPFSDGKAYTSQYSSGQLASSVLTLTTGFGHIVATRTSSTSLTVYQKGASVGTSAAAESGSPTAGNVTVFGTSGGFTTHRLAGYSIGAGLSGTDATNFNTDFQAFQTALGRSV